MYQIDSSDKLDSSEDPEVSLKEAEELGGSNEVEDDDCSTDPRRYILWKQQTKNSKLHQETSSVGLALLQSASFQI